MRISTAVKGVRRWWEGIADGKEGMEQAGGTGQGAGGRGQGEVSPNCGLFFSISAQFRLHRHEMT